MKVAGVVVYMNSMATGFYLEILSHELSCVSVAGSAGRPGTAGSQGWVDSD